MILLGLTSMALGIGVLGGSESDADELGGDWLATDRLLLFGASVNIVDIAVLGLDDSVAF